MLLSIGMLSKLHLFVESTLFLKFEYNGVQKLVLRVNRKKN